MNLSQSSRIWTQIPLNPLVPTDEGVLLKLMRPLICDTHHHSCCYFPYISFALKGGQILIPLLCSFFISPPIFFLLTNPSHLLRKNEFVYLKSLCSETLGLSKGYRLSPVKYLNKMLFLLSSIIQAIQFSYHLYLSF